MCARLIRRWFGHLLVIPATYFSFYIKVVRHSFYKCTRPCRLHLENLVWLTTSKKLYSSRILVHVLIETDCPIQKTCPYYKQVNKNIPMLKYTRLLVIKTISLKGDDDFHTLVFNNPRGLVFKREQEIDNHRYDQNVTKRNSGLSYRTSVSWDQRIPASTHEKHQV